MRVLFLDIDGVLNSVDWWRRRPKPPVGLSTKRRHSPERWARRNLDPAAIQRLQQIVDATEARVVVSSDWRALVPLVRLADYLRAFGDFTHPLLGATPLYERPLPTSHARVFAAPDLATADRLWNRGAEITAWLDLIPIGVVTSYVVLDDDPVTDHDGHFVQTSFEVGLTDHDVQSAIAILRKDERRRG